VPARVSAVIVTSNFWPEKTGIGQVNTELAKFLSSHGVDVHVVTGYPYYPEWSVYPGYSGSLTRTEHYEGIAIHRSWHYVRPNPGAVGRILHEITLALFGIPALVRLIRTSSTVFIVSPDLFFAFLASKITLLLGRRYQLVVQDVMPDAALELEMVSNRWVIKASKAMARRLYDGAEGIRTLGNGMRRRIAAMTRDPSKISVVPNAVDVRELAPAHGSGLPFRERFVANGHFAVVHSGNIGLKQDLSVLLEAADELRSFPDIKFLVFGDGAAKADFLRERDARRLDNVSHYEFQDRALVPHMLYGADVVLVSQMKAVVDILVPSKLQVAMAAGAMIVAACAENSESAEIIRESGAGILVPAGDGTSLAATLLRIRNGEENAGAYRTRAAEYAAAHFDQESLYGPICRSVRESAGSSPRKAS
jgi:colanic acid biosynthesis glycosyl transferase WcaI